MLADHAGGSVRCSQILPTSMHACFATVLTLQKRRLPSGQGSASFFHAVLLIFGVLKEAEPADPRHGDHLRRNQSEAWRSDTREIARRCCSKPHTGYQKTDNITELAPFASLNWLRSPLATGICASEELQRLRTAIPHQRVCQLPLRST
jgi:hypothetical protein